MSARALLPVADGPTTRRVAGRLLRPSRRPALAALLVLAVGTVAGLALPPVVGRTTDLVLAGDAGPGTVDALAAVLLAALAVRAAMSAWGAALLARVGETALARLREDVVGHALALPLAAVEAAGTGDVVARVGDDVDAVSRAVRDAVPRLVESVLTVLLTLVGLAALHPVLALAGTAAVPVHVVASRWYLRRSTALYAAERAAFSARAQRLSETVAGASTVRATGTADAHLRRVGDASQEALDATLRTARTGARFWLCLNGAELVGTTAVLVAGFWSVRTGLTTVGGATAAALYFHGLFNPVGSLLSLLDTAQDASASLRRLVGVTTLPAEPLTGPVRAPSDGSVLLTGVDFAYAPGHEVLHDVDLSLAPGTSLALVGPSGAGKSTIAALVAGVHRPTAGAVRVGGTTHGELGPVGSRAAVVLVSQEVHVFAGTVAEDLRLARPGASDAEVLAALETVGAREWVEQLPAGPATLVGEGGHPLTAAQGQQLALARVALTRAPVVVLDEATAEAGSSSARSLEAAAQAVTAGRTTLVVAHRLTQAASADRIAVVERGRVVEVGTHAELRDGTGPYARLWDAWSRGRSTQGTAAPAP